MIMIQLIQIQRVIQFDGNLEVKIGNDYSKLLETYSMRGVRYIYIWSIYRKKDNKQELSNIVQNELVRRGQMILESNQFSCS